MRINFRSPKTEHHQGKDRREIPLFPELLQPLLEEFEMTERGEEMVLPFLRRITGTALRKPLVAAITKAQAKPWPKLWNALRASRVTELREEHPAHVVDAWLGHDDNIARKHYTQTLDEHFEKAVQKKCSQKCSHFASSRDSHGDDSDTEIQKNPAQDGIVSHGVAVRWAMRDSNPRHPRCKRGALNQLS